MAVMVQRQLAHIAEQPTLPVWTTHTCNGGLVHLKQVPLQLGDEQGHVVEYLKGQPANLVLP